MQTRYLVKRIPIPIGIGDRTKTEMPLHIQTRVKYFPDICFCETTIIKHTSWNWNCFRIEAIRNISTVYEYFFSFKVLLGIKPCSDDDPSK